MEGVGIGLASTPTSCPYPPLWRMMMHVYQSSTGGRDCAYGDGRHPHQSPSHPVPASHPPTVLHERHVEFAAQWGGRQEKDRGNGARLVVVG